MSPLWLTLLMPGLFGVGCIVRTVGWVRNRNKAVTADMAFRRLIATNRLAAPIAVFCVSWSLALLRDGDAYQQAHVVFFMAITVIGIIFCLMHLRSAALVVAVTVNLPFFIAMMLTGKPTFIAAGFNVLLVTGAMIAIVVTHYRDFRQLHESRQVLLTQQEKLQALSDENLRLANLDSLTSIANRRSFFAALDEAFDAARRNGGALAVGIIDLDGFKPINDMYGHAAGDRVLVEVAERLQHAAGPDLRVFRLGGDEFALLNTGDCAEKELSGVGQSICQSIAARIDLGGRSVQVTASIGFAVFPGVGDGAQDLYERADYALYAAKRDRRGGVVVFNADQAERLDRQRQVEGALLSADLDHQLFLLYQPIFDIRDNRCVGFEALARWHDERLGLISPGEFVPIAEHNGRINLITRILLAKALSEAKTWPSGTYLSFNLSPHDLASADTMLRIISLVQASGFDPCRINFEITETAVIRDFAQAIESLALLRNLGVSVSLDDFGTGYSSLTYVHKLPLSKIKIDRSFVSDVNCRPASAKIITSVLSLCRELDLGAIIEGVETQEELETLKALGAQVVQGYYFSKPLTPAAARSLALNAGAASSDGLALSAS
ncbi:putative bifunctional diguanylate cyclase/phosphodiesterase [Rhizobium oryzicola]|uniref:EAL domain-containing protein n=1 Tax=Rhizobium oryzicola TaxID=1232668 RepID=A0ABT8SVQ3_9HYPH|nr:EAL domain-containing protein [Rhizobium oryzicola]MDO1582508.1 EAL domain-containing protein [Rhizobium oryzicola]